MNHERNSDTEQVKNQQWSRKDEHGQRIGSGRNDGRNHEDDENSVADVLPQELRTHDAEEREEQDKDGQLKGDAQAQDHSEKEIGVLVYLDQRPEFVAEGEEKVERAGEDPAIAEVSAGKKQADRRRHERHHITLLILVEPGRDEQPYLVQHKGRSQNASAHEADLQVHVEAVNRIVNDELRRETVLLEREGDRSLHQVVDLLVEAIGHEKSHDDEDSRADETTTQLLEVLEKAHSGKFGALGYGGSGTIQNVFIH